MWANRVESQEQKCDVQRMSGTAGAMGNFAGSVVLAERCKCQGNGWKGSSRASLCKIENSYSLKSFWTFALWRILWACTPVVFRHYG